MQTSNYDTHGFHELHHIPCLVSRLGSVHLQMRLNFLGCQCRPSSSRQPARTGVVHRGQPELASCGAEQFHV
jgi:hypothetical protein